MLPLEDKTGWFNYEDLGELQSRVEYCVGLHGGIYYIRRSEKAAAVFAEAATIAGEYPKYNFKGRFATPGDEPILALAMALHDCRPVPFRPEGICCYWEHENAMELSMAAGLARVRGGNRTHLVHWGTRFTRGLLYQKQVAALELLGQPRKRMWSDLKYDVKLVAERVGKFGTRVNNKLGRILSGR